MSFLNSDQLVHMDNENWSHEGCDFVERGLEARRARGLPLSRPARTSNHFVGVKHLEFLIQDSHNQESTSDKISNPQSHDLLSSHPHTNRLDLRI